jgi:SAM-dependent methyltransferase
MKNNKDVYGADLMDYYTNTEAAPLILYTNDSKHKEIMPVDLFFRGKDNFPEQELIALALCEGKVLDIGAGVGSHSLYLQEVGFDVTALELSSRACEIMKRRGVMKVVNDNIYNYESEKYDTLLFLMNGIGLVETIGGLERLFEHVKKLLKPGGQLLFDSSDINYYYKNEKDKPDHYYGEIRFQYEYKGQKGEPFGWLYIDQNELIKLGNKAGWVVQILDEDNHYQYLARMEINVNS